MVDKPIVGETVEAAEAAEVLELLELLVGLTFV